MTVQNSLEHQGNFLTHPFAELLVEISRAGLSGSLRLSLEEKKSIVYFTGGFVVFAVSNARKHKLFEILQSSHPEQAAEITQKFANDLELLEYLRSDRSFSEADAASLLSRQLTEIVLDVLGWPNGDWRFDPLARARADVSAQIDLPTLLLEYARSLPDTFIADRFRSFTEIFAEVPENEISIDLRPAEAYILGRIQGTEHSVQDMITLSGVGESDVLRALYSLWMAGLLIRRDWNPAFSDIKIASIRSANLVLKKSAVNIIKKEPKKEERAAEPKAPEPTEPVISIDVYLKRVEGADSLYDLLGLPPDCSLSAVRKSYFSLAKQFHPDKFHRGDAGQLRRIESAFSNLAHAYETLKDPKSRELYDSKLRRERAERANREEAVSGRDANGGDLHSERASQEFEHGRDLLMNGDWEEATPFLARAAHFVPNNARFQAFYGKALSNDKNQQHKAVNAMQKAVSLDPQNAAFRMMLAEFLVKVNLLKRAEGELNRLLTMQPDHKEARSLLDSLSRK